MTEQERAQLIIDRIRSHSKVVAMIVDDAVKWVDSGGRDGLRDREKAPTPSRT